MQPPSPFVRVAYRETLDLLVEARNYLTHGEGRRRGHLAPEARLRLNCEALRVTSRLTYVMSWLMLQRAVENGELTPEEAGAEPYRLAEGEICLDDSGSRDGDLPSGLRSLLQRSHRLYVRIARLERTVQRHLH